MSLCNYLLGYLTYFYVEKYKYLINSRLGYLKTFLEFMCAGKTNSFSARMPHKKTQILAGCENLRDALLILKTKILRGRIMYFYRATITGLRICPCFVLMRMA